MDEDDIARELHERAEHARGDSGPHGKSAALLICFLGVALALFSLGEKSAETSNVSHNIASSDAYAWAQSKKARADTASLAAEIMESGPNAADPEVRKRIESAMSSADRLETEPGNGRAALVEIGKQEAELRDHHLHRYHEYEKVTGLLPIAMLLATVSIIAGTRKMLYLAAALGITACCYGSFVFLGVV